MPAAGSKQLDTIGFLTIREHAEQGFLGGYLILNPARRPLEFHCTAPVRPSRAQEILYGPTLRPFVYGEQIGQTLLEKTVSKPLFVCTDVEPALAVREHTSVPVLLVRTGNVDADAPHLRIDQSHATPSPSPRYTQLTLGQNVVELPTVDTRHHDLLQEAWQRLSDDFDLREPFGRIHDAIDEAQRAAAVASAK